VRQVLKKNIWFLLPWLAAAVVALIAVALSTRGDLHLSINSFHFPLGDRFFRYLTWLGNGWAVLILVFILSLVKMRYAILMFASFAVSGIVTQLLKHLVFPGASRPVEYLSGHDLYLVQGVKILQNYSFPSGHATTAFAVFLVLAHLIPSRWGKFLCALAAILIAYSRVYLSQHFTRDILAGSVIGITVALLFILLSDRIKNSWSDKALLSLIFKSGPHEARD